MIYLCDRPNRKLADKVYTGIKHALKSHSDKSGMIICETYDNCREQGYHLITRLNLDWSGDRAVSFAENRNSDDIVVYYGKETNFNGGGNIPSQEIYETQTRYWHGDESGIKLASEFIVEFLCTGRITL